MFIVIEWLHMFLLYVVHSVDWVEEICVYYFSLNSLISANLKLFIQGIKAIENYIETKFLILS